MPTATTRRRRSSPRGTDVALANLQRLAESAAPIRPLSVPVEVASAIIGVSPRYLEGLRLRGEGPPFFRCGGAKRGRVMYRLESLDRWMREREQTNTSQRPGEAA